MYICMCLYVYIELGLFDWGVNVETVDCERKLWFPPFSQPFIIFCLHRFIYIYIYIKETASEREDETEKKSRGKCHDQCRNRDVKT